VTRTRDPATRERIKDIAGELYVRRGHDGFSFGDVAAAIGTTRANIHHHFGDKRRLMAELIEGFVADAQDRIIRHWTAPGAGFADRLAAHVADMRRFHDRFNAPGERNVWSPLARIRLDLPALGDLAVHALERVDRVYDSCLRQAVAEAIRAGELAPETPVEEVARVLRLSLSACAPITLDRGGFREVERLFAGLARMILTAWGARGAPAPKRRGGRKGAGRRR
jgi:AcrR family transcriptional regulator